MFDQPAESCQQDRQESSGLDRQESSKQTGRNLPPKQSHEETEPFETKPLRGAGGVLARNGDGYRKSDSPPGSLPTEVVPFNPSVERRRLATKVLNEGHNPDEPKLTPTERKRLQEPVREFLEAGYEPGDLSRAIANSPFRTAAGIGGELRKQKQHGTSVGNRTLTAAERFVARHEGAVE
jgi:hypothetical protein